MPQPTEPTAAEVVAAISTAEPPPPELPMTEEQFQKLKVDAVFACLDVRYKEGGMGKDVVRLPSNWDARRKAKLPTYKIPKRKTSTVCPKVGSTPTSSSRPHKAGLNTKQHQCWHHHRHNNRPGLSSHHLNSWQRDFCSTITPGFNPQGHSS